MNGDGDREGKNRMRNRLELMGHTRMPTGGPHLSIFEQAGMLEYGHLPRCQIPDGVVENHGHPYNLMCNSDGTVREYVQYYLIGKWHNE